jgi:hypothetical protein
MPAISMFYGIIIYMYFFDNKMHYLPHIHAKYQDKLMANWELARKGEMIFKIDGLK